MLYFKAQKNGWGVSGSGLIEAPLERLERRKQRQFIGENFRDWADNYYGVTDSDDEAAIDANNENIGQDRDRQMLYNSLLERCPSERKWITPQKFKKKFKEWCDYRGFVFNPYSPDKKSGKTYGGDKKTAGTEYFCIIVKERS